MKRILFALPPLWPSVNENSGRPFSQDGYELVDLWEDSPVRLDDNESHTEEIVDMLFPGNPLLCCGKSKSEFATRRAKSGVASWRVAAHRPFTNDRTHRADAGRQGILSYP